ncbi:hypothetical protein D3P08_12330 [Paenibacillus nanensis]|uniref:Uncharacterized protein n=1 Tax=Paenibacillus nanensis TaxID=393251 RepID=A0A3A1UWY2_9BACL|nr:hypothetical protein [Paenibacillus nanensis]RIX52784.1 hypothetical protein D3P08_12330 [Paenibacillus nanensis]
MKRSKLFIGLGCTALLVGACAFALQPKVIKADRVHGTGKYMNEYSLSISPGGEIMIPSTQEEFNEVSDDSAINISYTVVYEQSKWFKNDQRILKILRFERPFPTDQNTKVQSYYYTLVNESLDVYDDKTSIFTRLYEKRDIYNHLLDLIPQSITVPEKKDIKEARLWIQQHNPQLLYLKDKTIVDTSVRNSWQEDGYRQNYSEMSPEGLSLKEISQP